MTEMKISKNEDEIDEKKEHETRMLDIENQIQEINKKYDHEISNLWKKISEKEESFMEKQWDSIQKNIRK